MSNLSVEKNSKTRLEVGDKVCCKGLVVTIAKIYNQFYDERDGFITEFESTDGQYRNWKQCYDGGYVL